MTNLATTCTEEDEKHWKGYGKDKLKGQEVVVKVQKPGLNNFFEFYAYCCSFLEF